MAMLSPSIEPETSKTIAMASVGRGLFFFASDQTGKTFPGAWRDSRRA